MTYPTLTRRGLLAALPALALVGCAMGGAPTLAPNSTLIVTRHGDRDDENLNDKGRARARALVTALDGMPLDAVHAPGIQRNLDTAAPLATARGLPIERFPQESPTAPLAASAAGRTVIWVGNKGNIATIWEDLALSAPAPLAYGDLAFIRTDATGAITVETVFYGPT